MELVSTSHQVDQTLVIDQRDRVKLPVQNMYLRFKHPPQVESSGSKK